MTAMVHLDGDQLIATRHLEAEPALVWEVFTTPAHLAGFWGGHHATVAPDSVTVDLRIGGMFEIETRGVGGGARRLSFTYEVIDAPTRLVFVEPRSGLLTEIRFEPNRKGTTVTAKPSSTARSRTPPSRAAPNSASSEPSRPTTSSL